MLSCLFSYRTSSLFFLSFYLFAASIFFPLYIIYIYSCLIRCNSLFSFDLVHLFLLPVFFAISVAWLVLTSAINTFLFLIASSTKFLFAYQTKSFFITCILPVTKAVAMETLYHRTHEWSHIKFCPSVKNRYLVRDFITFHCNDCMLRCHLAICFRFLTPYSLP